jgi:hypothetical protein
MPFVYSIEIDWVEGATSFQRARVWANPQHLEDELETYRRLYPTYANLRENILVSIPLITRFTGLKDLILQFPGAGEAPFDRQNAPAGTEGFWDENRDEIMQLLFQMRGLGRLKVVNYHGRECWEARAIDGV